MQFQVPQNIDMEDKIIGPMTITQFIYVVVGGTIVYIIFMKTNTIIFVIFGIPLALFTLAFTFLKVQDRPMSHFFVALLNYMSKPKKRVWQKGTVQEVTLEPGLKKKEEKVIARKKIDKSNLEKLAQVLDTGGWGSMSKIETPHTQQEQFAQQPSNQQQPVAQVDNQQPTNNQTGVKNGSV